MKRNLILFSLAILPLFIFSSCEKDKGDTGTLSLSITDAPVFTDDITAVYITVTEIHYHISGNEWAKFEDFEGPRKFNLLDLTRGDSEMLGSFELEAGTYTQLRFVLDAPSFGSAPIANPGCYLVFGDESTKNLFVPSGSQTGYKAVGAFTVPINGSVEVTADFDVRKSVVKAGVSGMYILKPTIRLLVDDQAGQIAGGVSNIPAGKDIVIYAYEDGEYDISEAGEPATETNRFPNAVTSDMVDVEGSYHLAFLAPGSYELVVTSAVEGNFEEVLGTVKNVLVESKKTTNQPIKIDEL